MNYRPSYHRGIPFSGRESELDRLRHEHAALSNRVDELAKGSTQLGIVVSLDEANHAVTVATSGGTISETAWPRGLALGPGTAVRLTMLQGTGGLSILDVAKMPDGGNVCKVERIVDEAHFTCSLMNQPRLIFHDLGEDGVKVGDEVLLDALCGITVVKNLGSVKSEHAYVKETGVAWEDIGGLENAKAALRDAVVFPVTHADLFARYKRRRSRGALLYGRPGNGKTMLGKAVATALATAHGKDYVADAFRYLKGPTLLNKWVGESEAAVRREFASSRAFLKKYGYPCVMMIDEADAVLGLRGSNPGNEGMERTIVPMFLAELDGFEESGCFLLLATNRPDRIDPAILRDGRVDRKIRVDPPTRETAEAIVTRALAGRPHAKGCVAACMRAVYEASAPLYSLETILEGNGDVTRHLEFTYADLVSGARLAGLVERATSYAMQREVAGTGEKRITEEDFLRAVKDAVDEERGLDHTADLVEWAETHKRSVTKVRRVA